MTAKKGRMGPLERLAMSRGERTVAAKRSRAAKKGAATRRRNAAAERAMKERHEETWDDFNAGRRGAATKISDETPLEEPHVVDSMAEISRRTWDGVKDPRCPELGLGTDRCVLSDGHEGDHHFGVDAAKLEAERRFAAEYGPAVTGGATDPAARLVAVQTDNMELERKITYLEHELAIARKDAEEARLLGMKAEAQLTKQERAKFSRDRQKLNMIRRVLAL